MRFLILLSLILSALHVHGQTIHTVGPGQQFLSLQNAYDSIPQTINQPYEIHLMAGYSTAYDSLPITFRPKYGTSNANTITIIPQVSGVVLFPDSMPHGEALVFDSCSHVIVDGRVGGVGDTADMQITNTLRWYNTILFDSASFNTIRYCNIQSVCYDEYDPSIIKLNGFGCTDNLFQANLIHGADTIAPYHFIEALDQSHRNTFDGNYFFDCAETVIVTEDDCDDWVISGNHIFGGAYSNQFDFMVNGNNGDNLLLTGNYFGGTAPFALGNPFGGGFIVHNVDATVSYNTLANWQVNFPLIADIVSARDIIGNNVYDIEFMNAIYQMFYAYGAANWNTLTELKFHTINTQLLRGGTEALHNTVGNMTDTASIQVFVHPAQGYSNFNLITGSGEVAYNEVGGIFIGLEDPDPWSLPQMNFRCISGNRVHHNLVGSETVPNSIGIEGGLTVAFYGVAAGPYNFGNYGSAKHCTVRNVRMQPLPPLTSVYGHFFGISGDTVQNCTVRDIAYFDDAAGIKGFQYVSDCVVDSLFCNANETSGIKAATVSNCQINAIYGSHKAYGIFSKANEGLSGTGLISSNTIHDIFGTNQCTGVNGQSGVSQVSDNNITRLHGGEDGIVGIETKTTFRITGNNIHEIIADSAVSFLGISHDSPIHSIIANNLITDIFTPAGFLGITKSRGASYGSFPDTIYGNDIQNIHCGGGTAIRIVPNVTDGISMLIGNNRLQSIAIQETVGSTYPSRFLCFDNWLSIPYPSNVEVRNNLAQNIYNTDSEGELLGVQYADEVTNNIFRLGMNETGDPILNGAKLTGIISTLGANVFHNTVYLNALYEDSTQTACIKRVANALGHDLAFQNNILFNGCSNVQNNGGDHLIYVSSNISGIVASNNIYSASGLGGGLASYNSGNTILNSLSQIQAPTSQHNDCYVADPLFVAADDNNITSDMSLNAGSVAFGNAIPMQEVAFDFFYAPRSFMPTIGAIEGIYVPCSTVLFEVGCNTYSSPSGNYIWEETGTYVDTVQAQSGCDSVFIIHLEIREPTSNSITVFSCGDYTSASGNHVWTQSGIYMDTIANAFGCDSVITVNFELVTVDTSITIVGTNLTANASGATFQWLNCDQNMLPMTGATNSNLGNLFFGSYAVVVTQQGCIDTSACFVLGDVGIEDRIDQQLITCYPNPASDQVTIQFQKAFTGTLEIFDAKGSLTHSQNLNQTIVKSVQLPNQAGIYQIQLIGIEGTTANIRVVNQ